MFGQIGAQTSIYKRNGKNKMYAATSPKGSAQGTNLTVCFHNSVGLIRGMVVQGMEVGAVACMPCATGLHDLDGGKTYRRA
jgi:hypothetical protein